MSAVLTVSELTTALDLGRVRSQVVERVSLRVDAGEIVGLIGESGSGKTMTALSIVRLLPEVASILSGEIRLGDRDIVCLSEGEMRRVRGGQLGMVFQDPSSFLDPLMLVGDQIVEALRAHRRISTADARAHAIDALRKVGIPDPERVCGSYPHELSGGMRQRAVIACATACRPKLVIADEPTTALDVTIQAQVMSVLASACATSDTGLLLITHDLGLVAGYCERAYVMYAGQIVESGKTAELLRSPRHPYTRALLRSCLRVDRRPDDLLAIEGQPPDFRQLPSGCRFHPRCRERLARCTDEPPPVVTLPDGHINRCWLEEHG